MEVSQTLRPGSASSSPDSSSGSSSTTTSKRTRVVVSQSKRGCLTCKARRVKCDELKPLCQRCLKAGRLCEGYGPPRKGSSSSSTTALSTSPIQPALKAGVLADSSTERLSHLAAHVLSLDNNGYPLTTDGVWGRIFLQLSNQVECVKAAAAAFGAAYELWFHNDSVERSSTALQHYGSALTRLRAAFASGTTNLESIALASMILSCAEIMTQHEENALNHFLGAVQIVYKTSAQADGKEPSTEISTIKDELVKVDILIGSYGLAQTPQIARFEGYGGNEPSDHVFREPHLASNAAMHCLYRSRQFIDAASKVRYVYPGWKDRDSAMCDAQSAMAAQCHTIRDGLAGLAERLQAESAAAKSSPKDDEVLADIYGLRTQITTTVIFVLCIHDPFQTAYDEQHALFQSIISDAAASSRLRRRARASALKRFSTRPGVVSPLFFVSMKCRDPSIRSLATTMLKEQGREGPSDGHIMAAIGARIAEMESPQPTGREGESLRACDVLEGLRIHGHGVYPGRPMSVGRRVLDVEFSRPNPPLAQGWGTLDYTDMSNWIVWKEPVEL